MREVVTMNDMATEKQIAANRKNARKSTGPKSQEGKGIARLNATKHGLRAKEILLPDEEPEQFLALCNDLADQYCPQGILELTIVKRIAECLWRINRAARIESAVFSEQLNDSMMTILAKGSPLGFAFGMINGSGQLNTLLRYEAAIERSLFRNVRELQRLQEMRAMPA